MNFKAKAFTLVEMTVVLLIMGILLMMTMSFSGAQIQKLENKSVKESIVTERQSRYSRNLWSSSYYGIIYSNMFINLSKWQNQISFSYISRGEWDWLTGDFSNNFVIKSIISNPEDVTNLKPRDEIEIKYSPYKMYCERWDTENDSDKLVIVMEINNSENYCFEINKKNCRLVEVTCDSSWSPESNPWLK